MTNATAALTIPNELVATRQRVNSIDLIRGLVLILMALDHSRHFFSNVPDPLSLTNPIPTVFFTRWITHFCAPVFIFLAGVSAYLYRVKPNQTVSQTSYFLLTRGLWFIVFEQTVLYATWTFFLVPFHLLIATFGAIGFSMVALSFIIFLPRWMIAAISILILGGHNLLDHIHFNHPIWMLLHERHGQFLIFNALETQVGYPILPWIGVICAGYSLGPVFKMDEQKRRRIFLCLGTCMIVAFALLRYVNLYGDPTPWLIQNNALLNLMSFINVEKYPPSLLYILITLGFTFLFLGVVKESWCENKLSQVFIMFGKVPFIFYLLHVPLILGSALIIATIRFGAEQAGQIHSNMTLLGYNLPFVYLAWICVLSILYWPCKRYGQIKMRSKKAIFSYL